MTLQPWFKTTLWWLGEVLIIGAILVAYIAWSIANIDWNFPVYKEFDARHAMMLELSDPTCLTRDAVIAQARANDWGVEDADSLGQCGAVDGLSGWLRIITPDGFLLPENPENTTFFGFDGAGCSIYLPVGAGAGGTCPE